MKKDYKVKPTRKQRLAVANLPESTSARQALLNAGYSEKTVTKPSSVTKSKGFIQAMEDLGITDEFLNEALKADIKAKKGNRLGELTLAYKLKGHLKEQKQGDKTLILNITQESAGRYAPKAVEHTEVDNNSIPNVSNT